MLIMAPSKDNLPVSVGSAIVRLNILEKEFEQIEDERCNGG